jgi:DNA-binding CsgD family transcriptional regulator/tetratricopeptide (TPR) repeat protein
VISQPLRSDDFVGRHGELGALHQEFAATCRERVRFVLVEGEAGIGKTRLIEEFRASLGPRAQFASGSCSEHIRAPYLAFTEILAAVDPRRVLPLSGPRDGASYGEERAAYFTAVAQALSRAGARKPLVVSIEDVHWADSATLELLRFLLQRLGNTPVLLLATLRTEGVARHPGLTALRSAASRGGFTIVTLGGLRRNEIGYLVQQTLRRANAHVDRAGISQIEVLAEGNPLFAQELARIAVTAGGEPALRRNVPLSLQAILSERLAPFSEEERDMLVRAAIIGQSFEVPLLVAISGQNTERVLAVMQRAVDRELLEEVVSTPLRFRFHHELIRQALADQLVQAVAAPLHVRIAQEIERRSDAESRAAELAYHWSSARVPEKARHWNEAAADAAWRVFAYRDAIRFYSAALRWSYPPGRERAAIFERLGTLLYIDGCGDEPATWFSRCRQEYEAAGDAVGAARALLLLADQSWVDARTDESLRAASEAAASLDRLGYVALYGDAILTIARFSMTLGNAAQARSHLRSASRLASHFDRRTKAMLYEVSGEIHAAIGDATAALNDFRTASALAHETGLSELIAQIENNFALSACDLGEITLAAERHQVALGEANRTGMMWRVAYCSLTYARTLTLQGRFDEARALARQALESGATTATFKTKAASVGIPLALVANDSSLLESCADEHALQFAERSRETQRIASVAAAFAQLRVSVGRQSEARHLLTQVLRAIPQAHRCWDFFLAVARWGSAEDIALARTMLAAAPGRPRVQRAYSLLFLAITQQKKDPLRSKRLASIAARAFESMGDGLHARDANALQAETGSRRSKTANNELTHRQNEIAHLVAEGATNKSIAARLSVSEHTVEHHISAIFERLGIKSRAQLANFVARLSNK